jgi:hypothetical protein
MGPDSKFPDSITGFRMRYGTKTVCGIFATTECNCFVIGGFILVPPEPGEGNWVSAAELKYRKEHYTPTAEAMRGSIGTRDTVNQCSSKNKISVYTKLGFCVRAFTAGLL